jgi:DNA-binding transcriptional ArsR family regulator
MARVPSPVPAVTLATASPATQDPLDLAQVFFALGDGTRLRLMTLLCGGGSFSTTELTANTPISRQAVTKHLQVLAGAGLVRNLRVGRERLWQLDVDEIGHARASLEAVARQWDEAVARVRQAAPES